RVAFKPTATIRKEQRTVTTTGEETILAAKGRHDPCVLPRAVPKGVRGDSCSSQG
ncbi:MAG: chorismate synthase, partial [Moorea sp. SIO3I7]|nr:chorismate synthase [Moorena sp. SIO3I7]